MKIPILCLVLLLLVSCKSETKKKVTGILNSELKVLENPSVGNSSLPRLFSNNNKLYLSWIEKKDTVGTLNFSVFENEKWSPTEAVISGSDWFTNWADFPTIATTPNGNILTSFLQKSAGGTYTYDVKLNLYNAETNTWKKNFILHNDGTKSEHGFVSIRPYTGNSFLVVWLDGRETAGKEHGGGQMTLRGAIVFEDGTIEYDTLLDKRTCDCCQTGVAIGPNDEIIAAYRDRSEEEIRDISIVRWQTDVGWSKPQTIGNDNWKIAGCPVNGPSIDAYGKSLAVAWFTAADDSPKVQVAFSQDIGETFGLPFRIDNGNTLGRVDIDMISDNTAIVSWMENKGGDTLIQVMKIENNGSKGRPITIAKTRSERASGFPQLEMIGTKIYVAWTNVSKKSVSNIDTAVIDLSAL
mgnify:CR=1 FL=1|jgi:hypothetical protein